MDVNRLRRDAEQIALSAIADAKPDAAIQRAFKSIELTGNIILVAIGKAAWQMAAAAVQHLEKPVAKGIVLTKYGHVLGDIPNVCCLEAGHPVPDENSIAGTQAILNMTQALSSEDTVLFLVSGGSSALFEKPLIPLDTLKHLTSVMLSRGMNIYQINTVRKRLSAVKGGRFAQWCAPARVEAIVLSDVLGDAPDLIASGPAAPDPSTCQEATAIAKTFDLPVTPEISACLETETPKTAENVHTQIIGSVRQLCSSAAQMAAQLGYRPVILTDSLCCEAADAGRELVQAMQLCRGKRIALIEGGETVVHVTGTGRGGRNQELALAAGEVLRGQRNMAVISLGSDGTDGPTDAAGGYADGHTAEILDAKGLDISEMLRNNDAYHALEVAGGLIKTGPTGTNVNDITIGLISEE